MIPLSITNILIMKEGGFWGIQVPLTTRERERVGRGGGYWRGDLSPYTPLFQIWTDSKGRFNSDRNRGWGYVLSYQISYDSVKRLVTMEQWCLAKQSKSWGTKGEKSLARATAKSRHLNLNIGRRWCMVDGGDGWIGRVLGQICCQKLHPYSWGCSSTNHNSPFKNPQQKP